MTPRERPAAGGVFEAPPRENRTAPQAGAATSSSSVSPCALLWEELYRGLPRSQQSEVVSLARRQGVLYAHQVPAPSPAASSRQENRQWLTSLLNDSLEGLEPFETPPIEPLDAALDASQREAVAMAVHTPDICLIQGLPGTGKSRVVAEIILQAARRGEKVLLLAPTPEPIDHVLGAIGSHETVCAVRCVAAEETVETLPPAIRALTFKEHCRVLEEQAKAGALRDIAALEQREREHRQEELLWPELAATAEEQFRLSAQLDKLSQSRQDVPKQTEQTASTIENGGAGDAPSSLVFALREAVEKRVQSLASLSRARNELSEQIQRKQQEQQTITAQVAALAPMAEAKRDNRWWTQAWWQATFRGGVLAQVDEWQRQGERIQTELNNLTNRLQGLADEEKQVEARYRAERTKIVEDESLRRQGEVDEEIAGVQREILHVTGKTQSISLQFVSGTPLPTACTPQAVETAHAAWLQQVQHDQDKLAFSRQWLACLQGADASLSASLLDHVNVAAACTTSLSTDEHFGDAGKNPVVFDLLVLERADEITESELLRVARRARRCVLVGMPTPSWEQAAGAAKTSAAKSLRSQPLRPGAFQRLWRLLHADPRRLPFSWMQEGERFCCQFRPLTTEQRAMLESEYLADHPEIELRILTLPRVPPALVEIVFPPSMSVYQAKEYIFQELQEVPVRTPNARLRWREEQNQVSLQFTDASTPETIPALLEPGVRERLIPGPSNGSGNVDAWQTFRLEFDRSDGWDRRRAEEWVYKYLKMRVHGRTVCLDRPYRMKSDLAAFLSDLLYAGAYQSAGRTQAESMTPHAASVHFVPVPGHGWARDSGERPAALREENHHHASSRHRPVSPRGGAGLEMDLSQLRHGDRLPSEVRACLPNDGIVNYLEAQTIVRALENFVAQDAIRRDAENSVAADEAQRPVIAVVALYSAQAKLIRLLLSQTPALASLRHAIQVDTPEAFREREYPIVLVSLTRSHSHRAVSFGEGPHSLALSLTRAQSRLLLFGDPGTLLRRWQWKGPLDHLDEIAAAQEQELIGRLTHYLRGQGAHPTTFHLCEGSCAS